MTISTVSSLFDGEPMRWSMRGDPFLWREMRTRFADVPLPSAADELATMVADAFLALAGSPIDTPQPFFVDRFCHGGITGGQIDPRFWRGTLLPLLIERWAAD